MRNLLKSFFISIFPLIGLYVTITNCLYLFQESFEFRYLGTFVSSSTIVFFFLILFIKPIARTEAIPKIYTSLIFLGFLTSIISEGVLYQDISNLLPVTILFLGWIIYLKWYSVFEKRQNNNQIKIDNLLPHLEFENINKEKINTSSFIGNPAIYIFYRGNWCPLCMAQIKEIAEQYKGLKQRGVSIIFISPQPHGYTKKLAKKFSLDFTFLKDVDNKVARKLNIISENGIPFGFQALGYNSDTVMPTVIITDKNGKIVFADQTDNYRVRPEPETFIQVLNSATN